GPRHLRRAPGPGILQPAARDDHAGVLRGSGVRRQPRQGRMEDDRLPRRDRDLLRAHQDVPQQEIRRRAEEHSRFVITTNHKPPTIMATRLKEVDVVIVGLGWTGGILAKELSEAGMRVVALERGGMRATNPDFAIPLIRDELKYAVRNALMQNPARDTLTFRHRHSETALPMRQPGSF